MRRSTWAKVIEKKKYRDVKTPARRVRALEAPFEALGDPVAPRCEVVELLLRHLVSSVEGLGCGVLGCGLGV